MSDVIGVDDAINRAMSMTTVHVEVLLRQEGLLLSDVHGEMKACINIHTPEKEQILTAR